MVIRRIKFDTRRGGTLLQWLFIRLSPPSSRKLVASKTRAFSLECDQLNATSSVGLRYGMCRSPPQARRFYFVLVARLHTTCRHASRARGDAFALPPLARSVGAPAKFLLRNVPRLRDGAVKMAH